MNLNKHFQRQWDSNNCCILPEDIKNSVLGDFQAMSGLGIDNDDEQNRFFILRNNVPEIIHLVFNGDVNDKVAGAIAAEVYRNRKEIPIDTLLGLIEAIDLALKKMIPKGIRPKVAYPQPGAINPRPQYDIHRWVLATRQIYDLMNKGHSSESAKNSIIGKWDTREKMDYEQWLKFYKEKVPEKYPKLAADESTFQGFPFEVLQARPYRRFPNPIATGEGHTTKVSPGLPQSLPDSGDVRERIERQRNKIISRLNSAEKMLASMDGQDFAGDDQELMLKLLQDLKRRIQIANKRTVNSSLFEDHIYRTANMLKTSGKDNAAGFFYKLAQLPDLGLGPDPMADMGMETPGGEAPAPAPTGDAKAQTHQALAEFFENLKRGINDPDDTKEEREAPKEEPPPPAAPAPAPAAAPAAAAEAPPPPAQANWLGEQIKIGAGSWIPLRALAQLPPAPLAEEAPPAAPAAPPPSPEAPIEVQQPVSEEGTDNTDDVIAAALNNVTVNDVIKRLEMLVSIYNQREISRQLAILDIMMDQIGLASFFPAMGEAMSKALEANQYIGSRLEDVLTKIKGSVDVPGTSKWIEVVPENNPETAEIRHRLEVQKEEAARQKELRRQRDLAKMEGAAPGPPPAPVGESADLQQPARIEKAPPIQTR